MLGLTSDQVQEHIQRGEVNTVDLRTSRPVKDIILKNVFDPVNVVLYAIGFGLVVVGEFKSAFFMVALVIFNAAVGVFQEVRAKRQLDQIALLAHTEISVLRDGNEMKIDPSELVLNDVLIIHAGDQIPVDGVIVDDGSLEVDESALTGESDLVMKSKNNQVMSGTICISGKALIEATKVGEDSFASHLARDARKFNLEITPLQRSVNRLLRVVLLIVLFFAFLAVAALFVLHLPVDIWLQILAVITGSVSAGLLTLITLNYSWGAVRIGQKGGLVQQISAIESLSNVTVLCTDKTGTLTANRIQYHDNYPIGIEKHELERVLAIFAASATALNKTSEAITRALPGVARTVTDEVVFSSARKWSALAFDDPGVDGQAAFKGIYVLGALEMLRDHLVINDAAMSQLEDWSGQGLRVLVFACNPSKTSLHSATSEPELPPLSVLGLISFSDELRPHLEETIKAFADNAVKLKVISGDNSQTVAALARQAGFPGDLKAVSGPELAKMSQAEFTQTALDATVFGRITPQQKEALVDALRSQGEYVAMMGDGVNDVLSLKKANLGIAMESGTTATRSVAAMVLLNDSFEVLPEAFTEGQRIVNSIQEMLKLFMATVYALFFLIIGISILGIGFPYTTLQSTLVSFFARGIPPLVLALTATAGRQRQGILKNTLHFTLPASILIFVFGLLVYVGAYFAVDHQLAIVQITQNTIIEIGQRIGRDYSALAPVEFQQVVNVISAQSALTTFFIFTGILLMVFAQPPVSWLAGGSDYRRGSRLPLIAAALLLVAYAIVLAVPPLGLLFDLIPLPAAFNIGILLMTLIWAVVQLAVWRAHVLEHFLDIQWNEELVASSS